MENNTNIINTKDFEKGVKMILNAFKQQKDKYLNIIKSMQEKINILEDEIKKLQEVNVIYKNKLNSIQKNIKHISNTICQLKDEERDDFLLDNLNTEKNISNKNKENIINKKEKSKEKNNKIHKRHSFNKYELKKILYENNDLNKIFTDKRENIDENIKTYRSKNHVKNNILKNLYNSKNRNKKKFIISISNGVNNNKSNRLCLDNKSESLNKKDLYNIDGNYL